MPVTTVGGEKAVQVVVVGGSYGGVAFVTELEKIVKDLNVEITLVERRDKMHHCIGAFRSVVELDFADKLRVPYDKLFTSPRHRVLQRTVTEVHANHLVTKDGYTIPFDYLVVATGSKAPSPCKTESISSQDGIIEAEKILAHVQASRSVLVVGGGASGVELAGEIKSMYPDKKVTLVHKRQRILDYPNFGENFKLSGLDYLNYLGVNVMLGEEARLDGLDDVNSIRVGRTSTETTSGKVIESDIQFFTIGTNLDTSFMETLRPPSPSTEFSLSSIVDPTRNDVRVLPTLQLDHPSFSHIFAVGDVCNVEETRTAFGAQRQAAVAAKNVSIILRGAGEELTEYVPTTMMLVAMGARGGVAQSPIGTFGSWFVRWAKSRDVNVERRWKAMGLGSPFQLA